MNRVGLIVNPSAGSGSGLKVAREAMLRWRQPQW